MAPNNKAEQIARDRVEAMLAGVQELDPAQREFALAVMPTIVAEMQQFVEANCKDISLCLSVTQLLISSIAATFVSLFTKPRNRRAVAISLLADLHQTLVEEIKVPTKGDVVVIKPRGKT